ncbi:MAG: oxygen-independent coproporphyrinogen III oxidase [Proteobacteria bacterium]|nr:oxygen-independent coproporphyrinogen III oxidase [Pseudomonadota bacterium]
MTAAAVSLHALPAAAVLRRCDRQGPRYTSYPSAQQFDTAFGAAEMRQHAEHAAARPGPRLLSLYVHVPFCPSPCFYCGCNRLITRDTARGPWYCEQLLQEAALIAPLLGPDCTVVQLHLGGGTPNFLAAGTLATLIRGLDTVLPLSRSSERDFSIELDPRSVPGDYPAMLAQLGFNRVSLGVQDFDPRVQRAVNRIQTEEQTFDLIDACRDQGIGSVNIDLIYGLPRQTPAGFRHTLRLVMSARPDRLAVYGYAHLPGLFKGQRHIATSELPEPAARLELLRIAIEELTASGYRYVGMDHFAVPDDELVRAQEAGRLQRNFMGYTTHAGCDLVGLGVSAISHLGASFSQNFRDLKGWEAAIRSGRLPVWRGLALSADDRIRAEVIEGLMCHGTIEVAAIERRHGIDFDTYFSDSLLRLKPLVEDGLVQMAAGRIAATLGGRLLLRNIAMCFDAYLHRPGADAQSRPASRTV